MAELGRRILRVFDVGLDCLVVLSGFLLLGSMLAISVSTISRSTFGYTIPSTGELSTYMLLYITMLSAPWILREGHHIAIDILPLRERTKVIIDVITGLASIGVFGLLSYVSYGLTLSMRASGYRTATSLSMPRYLLIGIIFVGAVLLTVQFVRNLVTQIRSLRHGTIDEQRAPTQISEG